MNAHDIMESEDFKRCAAFHGHVCPGLSIGYRAARAGMEWLKERTADILEKPEEAMFTLKPVNMTLPPKARIEPSEPCVRCGEPAMLTKMEVIGGMKVCRGCVEIENTG